MRFTSRSFARLVLPVIAGTGCMIALVSTATAVAEWKDVAPRIGDIIAFGGAAAPSSVQAALLLVRRTEGRACILDLHTLQRSGGSFVIGGRPSGTATRFVVHWAGARTADHGGDCGAIADFVLDRSQLDTLSVASRGWKLGPPAVSMLLSDAGT